MSAPTPRPYFAYVACGCGFTKSRSGMVQKRPWKLKVSFAHARRMMSTNSLK
jgi:hypothetical protein